MDYRRCWLEERGSEDSQGRALWALGTVLSRSNTAPLHNMAGRIFEQSLPSILETTSPRAWSFALLGLYEYLQRFAGDRAGPSCPGGAGTAAACVVSAEQLGDDWRWFEPVLSYCNASLAHAMLLSGESIPDPEMASVGLEALTWLMDLQRADAPTHHFVPIGSNGFYPSGKRAGAL